MTTINLEKMTDHSYHPHLVPFDRFVPHNILCSDCSDLEKDGMWKSTREKVPDEEEMGKIPNHHADYYQMYYYWDMTDVR